MESPQNQQEEVIRVRVPRNKEVIGIVDQRLGASRMKVNCLDGNSRVCRIPGRLKRKLWIREKDIVLVEPWEFEEGTRGDIIYKYRQNQVDWLRRKGYIKSIDELEEF